MRQAYRTRGMTGLQGVQEVHELQEVQEVQEAQEAQDVQYLQEISRPRITPVSTPATIAIPTFPGTIDP